MLHPIFGAESPDVGVYPMDRGSDESTNVFAFAKSLLRSAWFDLTGGIGAGVLIVWQWVMHETPTWLISAVISLTFFVGAYFNWRAERRERLAAEARPSFEGSVIDFSLGDHESDYYGEVYRRWHLLISVRNTGTLPSIVQDWEFVSPTFSAKQEHSRPHLSAETFDANPQRFVNIQQDAIQPGNEWTGYIEFLVYGDLKREQPIEIRFKDVRNNTYRITWKR
jgi:hypothetical protein